ncbi:MAG: T9SS type A sorting domain-containing protein [Bacteroidota bacterium]
MKKSFLLILISTLASTYGYAQPHFTFTSDPSGNRTSRIFYPFRLANPSDSIKEDELQTKYGLSVYPNPTMESINIVIPNLDDDAEAWVILYDEQGNQLFSDSKKSKQQIIQLSSYAVGIYFLEIKIGRDKLSYRIQKN